MRIHPVDLAIIALYVASTLVVGIWVSRRASRSLRSYFLGGNEIPWYMLGLSNASAMFDISGTMWLVYLLFVYGLKSIWLPWLWPVFNQIFLMVFLSVWLRRSGVMTGAEWIRFRFGESRGARLAHIVVVVFAILNVIGFLAYGFVGIGKFAATFLHWQLAADPATNERLWALLITALATTYVVKGGMFSVVWTEVLQFAFMTVASICVGVIAMMRVTPEMLDAVVPAGWRSPWFGTTLSIDWSGILDAANARIAQDGWSLFSIFFTLMLFKGVLQSMAGPAPNYDMQRVLSARSPKDAAKLSFLVNVVLPIPRYMLVTGLTVLVLAFFVPQLRTMGDAVDLELILPLAMRDFVPTGLLGLLIAALFAAFMGTYAATVNAAPAYIVNDIYRRYIDPHAEERTYVRMSYVASLAVVVVGAAIGLFVDSLNGIVQWIVAALFGGYTAANLLKWYWWRFNAWGYFWGMLGGIVASMLIPAVWWDVTPLYLFPTILAVSLLGCVAGSLLTPPDDETVLKNFYLRVRPWGAWGHIHALVAREHPEVRPNRGFARDAFNVAVGVVWQTALTAIGVFLVLKDVRAMTVCLLIIIVTSATLKRSWYDRLEDHPADLPRCEMLRDPPARAVAVGAASA